MLDKDYIAEIGALEKKEAKEKLAEYAETFGIKLKKTKAFDNMVADLEVELAKLAEEPMPEDNDGLSIYDLIQADDEAKGTAIFKDEAKEEARLLIDSVSADAPQVKVTDIDPHFGKPMDSVKGVILEAPIGDSVIAVSDDGEVHKIPVGNMTQDEFNEAMDKVVKVIETDTFELPADFSPSLHLIGRNPGYATLPWWIYQWILENPDWKSRPLSFEHPTAHQTLLSLIYYIKRNGSVQVRETRNSSFVTLS
ncbi:minor head protein inhibitor of protease [Enterobacter phage CC31]|uniref:Inhibitor of prohead protease gp21 n=1 Tax=Enterobacter phage CC31 TaxID=709484 RepID=E5DIJ6_9CAUD|nr:minor head protein inhibitor of protease [Enterobacter phage CC31]ADB81681.1 inhibitor of prohead protease gp21 [Enterobacter phage CC31]